MTYLNTTLNTTHAWGRGKETLIPAGLGATRSPGPTAGIDVQLRAHVRWRAAALNRRAAKSKILCDIADRLLGSGGPVNWKALESHCQIRQMIAQIIPGYEPIGAMDFSRQEFQIAGRTFHEPTFKTPTGKALARSRSRRCAAKASSFV